MKNARLRAFCSKVWPVLLVIALLCGAATAALRLLDSSAALPVPAGEGIIGGADGPTQVVVEGAFSLEGLLWDGMILSALLAGVTFLLRERK